MAQHALSTARNCGLIASSSSAPKLACQWRGVRVETPLQRRLGAQRASCQLVQALNGAAASEQPATAAATTASSSSSSEGDVRVAAGSAAPSTSGTNGSSSNGQRSGNGRQEQKVEAGGDGGQQRQQPYRAQPRGGGGSGVRSFRQMPKATPADVIHHFEGLERRAQEEFGQRRGPKKRIFNRRRMARSEQFALSQLEEFEVEDALELFQVVVEIEFSMDSCYFPSLLPALAVWLHERKERVDPSVAAWVQIAWLHRLSPTMQRKRGPLLEDCLSYLSAHMSDVSTQEAPTVMLSAAYLQLSRSHPAFVKQLLDHVLTLKDSFTEVDELSDLVWSVARMQDYRGVKLVQEVLPLLTERISQLTPKFAANVVWATAMLGVPCPEYNTALAARVMASPLASPDVTTTTTPEGSASEPPPPLPQQQASGGAAAATPSAGGGASTAAAEAAAGDGQGGAGPSDASGGGGNVADVPFRAKQLANIVWGWGKTGFHPGQGVLAWVAQLSLQQARYFAPQDWDSLLWGYVKLGAPVPEELLREACGCVLRLRHYVQGRTLGGIIKSCGSAGYLDENVVPQLLEVLEERLETMTAHDLSNVMVGLGHLSAAASASSPYAASASSLYAAASQQPNTLDQAEAGVSTTAATAAEAQAATDAEADVAAAAAEGGLATAGVQGEVIGDKQPGQQQPVQRQPSASGRRSRRSSSDGSGGITGVPYLKAYMLPRLEAKAIELFASAAPQGLANITWGFAKLGYRSLDLLDAVAHQTRSRMLELGTRDCVDLLWSWARLEYRPDQNVLADLSLHLGRRTMPSSGYMWGPRELAITLWSLGTIGLPPSPALMANLRRGVQPEVLSRASAMDLANMLWGFARLEQTLQRQRFLLMVDRAAELLPQSDPGELSTIMLSLARMERYPGDALMEAAAARTTQRLSEFSDKALVHICSAFAKFQYRHEGLLDAVVGRAMSQPASFEQQDWGALLGALGKLAYNPGQALFDLLADQLEEQLSSEPDSARVDASMISSAMWAVALFDLFPSRLYSRCLEALADGRAGPLRRIDTQSLRGLYQAHLLACATGRSNPAELPADLRSHMSGAVDGVTATAGRLMVDGDSRLLTDIGATLGRVSVKHQTCVPAKHRVFAVDIVLDRVNEQVCIEALERGDVSRKGQLLLGPTLYRKRVLEAYDWKVLSVGFWDWEALGMDNDAKEDHLLALLRQSDLL